MYERNFTVIQGGLTLGLPEDYHWRIRYKRIGYFLIVAVLFVAVVRLLV